MSQVSKKVFIAMSGGVDSSVAAFLLKQKGYDVCGIFMKEWVPHGITCTSADDRIMAARVAAQIGIPFALWDFSSEYEKQVANYMLSEYANGRTPNPDIQCNKEIKFRLFLERAMRMGADYIATGHYIKKIEKNINSDKSKLYIASDTHKDQTYFLWTLTQKEISHTIFPLGEYTKDSVRVIAKKANLPSWNKKDSQGVCFVGQFDFAEFLRIHIPQKQGKVLNAKGNIIGTHDGTAYYTIGQRHGFFVMSDKTNSDVGSAKPLYVAKKDLKNNTIVVANEGDPLLYKTDITASQVNWISGKEPKFPLTAYTRIRYRQTLQKSKISKKSKKMLRIQFTQPQIAVTSGQSVVFYSKKEELLGGAVIETV
jgi:tRNA-uridine 2-sulfurtransferase